MDFERIDINQCPKGEGNKGPNKFADTARCKSETTEVSNIKKLVLLMNINLLSTNFCICFCCVKCEPLDGWGFRRGGYQCRCKPQHRLPSFVRRPFLGEILERASDEQYYNGFDCLKIGCKLNNNYLLHNLIILSVISRGSKNSNSVGASTAIYS
jgi:hypothetical protein